DPRRQDDEEERHAPEPEQDDPEERRRNTPRTGPLALFEQLAEDGDERRGESRVSHERAHGVRDQECDLERVDRAADAEVVTGDDLADEPEDPGKAGRPGEDRRRPREAPRRRWLAGSRALRFVHGPEHRPAAGSAGLLLASSCPRNAGVSPQCRTSTSKSA